MTVGGPASGEAAGVGGGHGPSGNLTDRETWRGPRPDRSSLNRANRSHGLSDHQASIEAPPRSRSRRRRRERAPDLSLTVRTGQPRLPPGEHACHTIGDSPGERHCVLPSPANHAARCLKRSTFSHDSEGRRHPRPHRARDRFARPTSCADGKHSVSRCERGRSMPSAPAWASSARRLHSYGGVEGPIRAAPLEDRRTPRAERGS